MNYFKYVKQKRQKAGVTQAQIAKLCGFHSQFVSNIERGTAFYPLKYVAIVADVCKADPKRILKLHLKEIEAAMKLDAGVE